VIQREIDEMNKKKDLWKARATKQSKRAHWSDTERNRWDEGTTE
jgi:hypothetical protein